MIQMMMLYIILLVLPAKIAAIPTLSNASGIIYAGAATTLTLPGTNFITANLVVNFTQT